MNAGRNGRPPFRADHVGSLLRPTVLRQAFKHYGANEIDAREFAAIQDDCIRQVVKLQEDAGLDVVTDGEFRRGSYWGRFVERTEGFEIRPAVGARRLRAGIDRHAAHCGHVDDQAAVRG